MVETESEVVARPLAEIQPHGRGPGENQCIVQHVHLQMMRLTLEDEGATSIARSLRARPFMLSDSAAYRGYY